MQSDWQTIIEAQASLDHSQLPAKAIVPLDHLQVVSITGEERQSFLQNLLTNDVQSVPAGEAQLNGLCNPKGRLLATFLLIDTGNAFQLILPACQAAFVSQRLGMFKLRAKVEISVNEELQVTGMTTENAPQDAFRLPYDSTRSVWVERPQTSAEWIQQQRDAGMELSTADAWQQADIGAGIGQIYQSTREMFTPQQVNFDLNGGVSFKKGCYPGQEVVARLHYLGKPNRRLFQAAVDGTAAPGDEVFNDSDKVAGHVFDVDAGAQVLISLKLADQEKPLRLAEDAVISNVKALAVETD